MEDDELADSAEGESGILSELELYVDGEKVANPYERDSSLEDAKDVRSYRFGEPGKYYYVNMMEQKGLWLDAQTNEPFHPEKLQIEIFDYVLPDKATIRLAKPSYGGRGEFGSTYVNVQDDYVIYPDGSRHEIEILEDED